MLTYKVTSKQPRVIDGLGVFAADETREFTQGDADWFARLKGVKLLDANLPDGVELTFVVTKDDTEEVK